VPRITRRKSCVLFVKGPFWSARSGGRQLPRDLPVLLFGNARELRIVEGRLYFSACRSIETILL